MCQGMGVFFPVLTVKITHGDRIRLGIKAIHVHVHTIRVGTRDIKSFDPAHSAKFMLSYAGIEHVRSELISATKQIELPRRNDKVQITRFATYRAIAVVGLNVHRRLYFKAHRLAMAASQIELQPVHIKNSLARYQLAT